MTTLPSWLLDRFRLSRRAYFADFWITPPITLALAYLSLQHADLAVWFARFTLGWVEWTFYEYAVHRWALHHLVLLRDLHGLHHTEPSDYIALHPIVTITIYVALWLIFGTQSSPFMIGFSFGYIVYSALHTFCHYGEFKPFWFLILWQLRHARHHDGGDTNFGVTTSFWDKLFGTEAR